MHINKPNPKLVYGQVGAHTNRDRVLKFTIDGIEQSDIDPVDVLSFIFNMSQFLKTPPCERLPS